MNMEPQELTAGHRTRRQTVFGLLFCISVLAGCGEQRAAPVDPVLARKTLQDVMEHWKSGGNLDELRKQSPEIVVQEMWWSDGRKLLSYRIADEGRVEDANWFCDVELQVESADGKEPVMKTFTYVVGTDPVLTVFRAIL